MTTQTYDDTLSRMWDDEAYAGPSDDDWHWYMEALYVDPAEMDDHRV